MFFYVLWILSGIFKNRLMRTPIEKMLMVFFISHYVRKTFLYYLIIGVTYLVLVLGEEDDNKTDWGMLGNIFGNGIIGVII